MSYKRKFQSPLSRYKGWLINLSFALISALSGKRIGLMSMAGVYIVLVVGMVVAFLTLIAEIYWKRKGRETLMTTIRK